MNERIDGPKIRGDGDLQNTVVTPGGVTYVYENATYFIGPTGTPDVIYRDPSALYHDLIAQGLSKWKAQEAAEDQNRRNRGY